MSSTDHAADSLSAKPLGLVYRIVLRAAYALTAGVAVAAAAFLCAWLELRDEDQFRAPFEWDEFYRIQESIDSYRDGSGHLPDYLADAMPQDDGFLPGYPNRVRGLNRRVFEYLRTQDGYELRSLGADDRPGGVGLNVDRYADGRYGDSPRLPLRQFLTCQQSRDIISDCFLAGWFTVSACLLLNFSVLHFGRAATWGVRKTHLALAIPVVIAVCMAGVTALMLAGLHIPSGH